MTSINGSSPASHLQRAHEERALAMARTGYLVVAGLQNAGQAVTALVTRAIVGVRAWRERRAVVRALQALDDRMLRDIGLERADIIALRRHQPQTPAPTTFVLAVAQPLVDLALHRRETANRNHPDDLRPAA